MPMIERSSSKTGRRRRLSRLDSHLWLIGGIFRLCSEVCLHLAVKSLTRPNQKSNDLQLRWRFTRRPLLFYGGNTHRLVSSKAFFKEVRMETLIMIPMVSKLMDPSVNESGAGMTTDNIKKAKEFTFCRLKRQFVFWAEF